MNTFITMLVSASLLLARAPVAATNNPKDEKAVMNTMEAMAQASIKKDIAMLDRIYHPDLMHSHSGAELHDKPGELKDIASPVVIESMTFHESTVRIYGNVALIRGREELRDDAGGKGMHDNHLNCLWVLLRGPGPYGWQIIARQTTRLPEKK